jgi:ABC-type Fe3+-hydroxamate transport system substrate-binding protein
MSGGNGYNPHLMFSKPPNRVISLVPSISDSLIELGVSDRLVGVTDFCPQPGGGLVEIPTIGGTQTPDLDAIVDLKPDFVLANQEENSLDAVEELEKLGIPVWVTFPKNVDDALKILWAIVHIFQIETEAAPRLRHLEHMLDWTRRATYITPAVKVFCPIWRGEDEQAGLWWMTINQETYVDSVLSISGGVNVFKRRDRRYPLAADLGFADPEAPGNRDTRYPRVTSEEVLNASPEVILLPSEPFAFGETEREELIAALHGVPAVAEEKVFFLDGSMLTWHGTRLAHALTEIPNYFQENTDLISS